MGGLKPDWLSQLAPAHAPPPPSWWPPAPGWWILLAMVVIALAWIIYWQRRPEVRLRRIALRELKGMEEAMLDDIALAQELENLLRRYAMARFGRDVVAGLSGERWIAFMVGHGATQWTDVSGTSLLRAAYGGVATNPERARWLAGARAFFNSRK